MDPRLSTELQSLLPYGLQIGALLLLAAYVVYSVVLYYHWREYTANQVVMRRTMIGYLLSTLPLASIMLLSAWLA